MNHSFPANRGPQAQPRLPAIPVPALNQRAVNGRPPLAPVVVQQRLAPSQMPSQVQPQMQRPMPPPAGVFPPHPPREIIPPQLHRPVVVSDIRPENQTEDDIREQLSDYIIFRFEKVEPRNEYDSEGEEVNATWDNCIRRRLPDVNKADARREIRRLTKEDAKKGKTFLEKQKALGPKGQNQLAKAQRELSADERDERFHINLAQVDCVFKPVVERHERVTRHRHGTKRKIRQKKRYERTSITAYFKRSPKDGQIPSELARRIALERQQFQQRQEQQQIEMMRQGQRQMQEQQMRFQHPQGMPQPHPRPMPGPPGGQMNRPHVSPMRQHNAAHGGNRPPTPIKVIHEHNGKDKHHKENRSRSSGSSEYSDSGSDSEALSESTLVTEPTRSSGSYMGKKDHGHRRNPHRYLEKAENFGIEVLPARRHSLSEGKSYIVTGSGTRIHVARPPRQAAIPVGNLEQSRADAYHAGRRDQRAEYRQLHGETGSLDTASRRYHPRYAIQPEVIVDRRSPTRIRHVTASEASRQLGDSFQRLRLGRELQYRDELDDILFHKEKRRREAIAREEQEQFMREMDEQDILERRRGFPSPMLNPFTPLSRRRTNSGYEFERGYRY